MRAFFVVFGVLTYAALIASLPTFDSASDDILDTIDFVNEPVFNDDVADLADSNLGANEKQECNADATDTGSFNAKLRARGKVCRVRPSGNTKPKTPSNNNQDNTETAPIDLSNMPKPDSVPPNKKMCPNNLVGVCSEDYYLPLKAGEIIPFVKPAYQFSRDWQLCPSYSPYFYCCQEFRLWIGWSSRGQGNMCYYLSLHDYDYL